MFQQFDDVVLQPGQSRQLRVKGEGMLSTLAVKLARPDAKVLRGMAVEIAFEDEANVCVRTPLGDFFGSGCGDRRFRSLPCGMTGDGYYAYWPMPVRKLAVVTLDRPTCQPPLKLPGGGEFKVELLLCGGPEFAALDVAMDGKAMGRVDARRPRFTPSFSAAVGRVQLTGGEHKLTLTLAQPAKAPGNGPAGEAAHLAVGLVAVKLHAASPSAEVPDIGNTQPGGR